MFVFEIFTLIIYPNFLGRGKEESQIRRAKTQRILASGGYRCQDRHKETGREILQEKRSCKGRFFTSKWITFFVNILESIGKHIFSRQFIFCV